MGKPFGGLLCLNPGTYTDIFYLHYSISGLSNLKEDCKLSGVYITKNLSHNAHTKQIILTFDIWIETSTNNRQSTPTHLSERKSDVLIQLGFLIIALLPVSIEKSWDSFLQFPKIYFNLTISWSIFDLHGGQTMP